MTPPTRRMRDLTNLSHSAAGSKDADIRILVSMRTVLFACVHNAARSQMAAAFFNELADPAKATAISAGTQPADRVADTVVSVMKEVGVDLSDEQPRELTAKIQAESNFLVTMGCGEACPLIPAFRRADWEIDDPADQPIDRVRAIRDDVRAKVAELVAARGWGR
jgi:arsenate reductase